MGRVAGDELLEAREGAARVVGAAEALGEGAQHLGLGDEGLELFEDAFAVLGHREAFDLLEARVADDRAGEQAQVTPPAEQLVREARDVDARLHVDVLGGGCNGGGHRDSFVSNGSSGAGLAPQASQGVVRACGIMPPPGPTQSHAVICAATCAASCVPGWLWRESHHSPVPVTKPTAPAAQASTWAVS